MRTLLYTLALLSGAALVAQERPDLRLADNKYGFFDNDLLSPAFHREKRAELRRWLPAKGMAVLFANPVRNRSNDVDFEYHQDPNLYYLTGLREPNAVLIVFKDSVELIGRRTNELLVVQERDPRTEVWNGYRLGTEGAEEMLGVSMAITGRQFLQLTLPGEGPVLPRRSMENLTNDPHDKADLSDLLRHFDATVPEDRMGEQAHLDEQLARMREVKHPEELALMRRAIAITCDAQTTLMQELVPGMTEYQTEAIVEYVFKRSGAEHEGFPSIQGGGPHSCVLHYVTNRRSLAKGDLLVSDIGAEYHGYTADVTRTLPVNGTFTREQRAIYDLVHAAQQAGIAEVWPGRPFFAAHQAATEVIAKGLVELGVIDDEKDVRRYFMHGSSHYLGLDVHDAGSYGPLQVNTVITVEPGIYIPEGAPCDRKWWGIGIRIEDDILVTPGGPENLSRCVPSRADEVEALMAGRKG